MFEIVINEDGVDHTYVFKDCLTFDEELQIMGMPIKDNGDRIGVMNQQALRMALLSVEPKLSREDVGVMPAPIAIQLMAKVMEHLTKDLSKPEESSEVTSDFHPGPSENASPE